MKEKHFPRISLVCEDTAQESFGAALCRLLGIRTGTRYIAPKGSGDAKQWIFEKGYPEAVKTYRTSRNHQNVGVLVLIDGDNEGPTKRVSQLHESLKKTSIEPRREEEQIAFFVPTWSIETWLLYLTGTTSIKEDQTYKNTSEFRKNFLSKMRAKAPAEKWIELWRSDRNVVLPALEGSFPEGDRVFRKI